MEAETSVVKLVSERSGNKTRFDDTQAIDKTMTPQVIIALCGPLGTPLHEVAATFRELLLSTDYGYEKVEIIRLSEAIRKESEVSEQASIRELIEAGNALREKEGSSILARYAIRDISVARLKAQEKYAEKIRSEQPDLFEGDPEGELLPNVPLKWCHIIDSIKNEEELSLLRSVYGDMLYVVGVYSPIDMRISKLERSLQGTQIHELIDRDSGEEKDYGQRVSKTFPQSDFFLRVDKSTDSHRRNRVKRFLDLMLGTVVATPTKNERAMYAAYSAARNSACLSRQVGAAIATEDGSVIATGWNDVPKAFGGLYQTEGDGLDSDEDRRCWNMMGGQCANDQEKEVITEYIVQELVNAEVIPEQFARKAVEVVRDNSRLKNLIEFSRAVHAEMHALLNAGVNDGVKIRDASLFVTTYPCHSCARHLVAAGIKTVYFLEPYRKSLATKLHQDAITENESDDHKVRILPFDGVAPARYLRFFSSHPGGRKKDGMMIRRTAEPVAKISLEAVSTLESLVVKRLQSPESK